MPFCDVTVYPRESTKKNKLRKSGNKLLKLRNDLGMSATYKLNTKIKFISYLLILLMNYVICMIYN